MISLRRNVLIFHQAALGDFVMTWPIAMAASRLWPTNRTIYITQAGKGALAERAIGVEWRDGDAWHALFSDDATFLKLPDAATKSLAGATLIISFVSNGNDAWANNVRRLAPEAQLICVRPRPEGAIDQHLTLYHAAQFAERLDLQAAIGQMIRHVIANGAVPRRDAGAGIVIHPGSGGAHKRWPVENFAQLARAFGEKGERVTVVLGEVERQTWPAADLEQIGRHANVVLPSSLIEVLATIQSASLYVGNDSGPTHVAALCGVPTLALFGADNDVVWRPLGPGVRVVKQVPLESLAVESVLDLAAELLASAPTTIAVPPDDD